MIKDNLDRIDFGLIALSIRRRRRHDGQETIIPISTLIFMSLSFLLIFYPRSFMMFVLRIDIVQHKQLDAHKPNIK